MSAREKRNQHCNFKLTDRERRALKRLAAAEALSPSALLRRLIILTARTRGLWPDDGKEVKHGECEHS